MFLRNVGTAYQTIRRHQANAYFIYLVAYNINAKDRKCMQTRNKYGDNNDSPTDYYILLPGASVAEVRPVGLSIAGVGGVAASKPTGTAVVGPGGLAIARPIATAIAGVPPDVVLGSGSQGSDQQSMRVAKENYVAVGPHMQYGAKYGVVPITRNLPRNSPTYFRFQPQAALNTVQYSPQPVLLYPVAYY